MLQRTPKYWKWPRSLEHRIRCCPARSMCRLFRHQVQRVGVSLPRERFWDIPVAKIDSPTRQPLCPGTPCGRRWTRPTHAEPNTAHKWLDGVSDVLADFLRGYGKHPPSPLRKSARTYAYRGLPAVASLSMAGSACTVFLTFLRAVLRLITQ